MRKTLIASTIFFISAAAVASGPHYQVFTQLKGLVVNYNVTSSNVETALYATNHERVPVVCDANMVTNRQETSKGRDTTIAPGKTAIFSFRHGKSITDVRLYLMCEAAKNTGVENDTASSTEPPAQKTKTENTAAQQPPIPVVEEDLDRY